MKETEGKILEVNRKKIEETMKSLQAEKTFDGNIQTLFLDFKNGAIARQEDLLRLRKTPGKVELTYKKVKHTQTAKIAKEYSVEVSEIETTLKILDNLGLTVIGKMEKHRISFKLDNAQFDVDRYFGDYKFIPEFLEIEAEDIKQIHKYAKILGYSPKDCLPWSTEELIQHYSRKVI